LAGKVANWQENGLNDAREQRVSERRIANHVDEKSAGNEDHASDQYGENVQPDQA